MHTRTPAHAAPLMLADKWLQINGEQIDPLATIVHRDDAYRVGKGLVKRLKELIPRQMFKVPIQAAIGARIVASESISGVLTHLSPRSANFLHVSCTLLLKVTQIACSGDVIYIGSPSLR